MEQAERRAVSYTNTHLLTPCFDFIEQCSTFTSSGVCSQCDRSTFTEVKGLNTS